MKSIWRSVGAFTVAAFVAASVVLVPARAHAEASTEFCDGLILTIEQVKLLPDSPLKWMQLRLLQDTLAMFCPDRL